MGCTGSPPRNLRPLVAKIVEEQEGIELARLAEAEGTASFTPAPSIVGRDFDTRFTGRST